MGIKTASQKIDRYLKILALNSGKTPPFGTYTLVAKKFGVSREWVRIRGKKLGITPSFIPKKRRIEKTCPVCEKEFTPKLSSNSTFSSRECWQYHKHHSNNELHLCASCGSGVLVKKAQVKRSKTKKFYCTRQCYRESDHLKNIAKTLTKLHGLDYFIRLSKKGNEAKSL